MSTILLLLPNTRAAKVVLCALLLALLSGCGSRQVGLLEGLADRAAREQPPLLTDDDGVPLSEKELKIFNATGQLDKGLSETARNDVAAQYKFFLRQGRSTMERFSQRSQTYLAYTRKVFRDRGLPEELAFLAIVESGYNPRAVSPAGAAGAWQFMPYTGLKYGLNQDWWMDERLDPYKAAEAAADYLAKLYGDFNDWHLAVAAYNAGEGKIRRALEGTGTKDFFTLKNKNPMLDPKAQLKEETKQYVPRFLAVCKIMRNLEALGFSGVDMRRPPPVVRVHARPGTDLMAMAGAAGMGWEEFKEYNAAHKRYVTHSGRGTYVYVPERSRGVAAAFAAAPSRRGGGWKTYAAGRNESWQSLSRKTGIPAAVLQSSNGGGALRPGSRVRLPAGPNFRLPAPETTAGRAAAPQETVAVRPAVGNGENSFHVLQPGETLSSLARKYNTSVAALQESNGVSDPRQLHAGRKLRIPSAENSVAEVRPKTSASAAGLSGTPTHKLPQKKANAYTVRAGDTLWSIARKHNLSTAQLLALNNADGKAPLRPGTRLLVSEQ